MKKYFLILLAITLFAFNCDRNPLTPSTGALNIQLIWPDVNSDALQKSTTIYGDPDKIKIILKLYGADYKEYNFNYSDRSGEISGLQPNKYDIDIYVFDVNGYITHTGSNDNIDVKAGQKAEVDISMKSFIPINITATSNTFLWINVSWDSPPGQISFTEYKVYRATSSDGSYSLVRDSNNITSFLDSNTDANKWYYYKVSAACSKGESAKSDYAKGLRTGG